MGKRIQDMRLSGKPIDADKTYKVAGWAPVAEDAAKAGNKMVWDVRRALAQGARAASRRASPTCRSLVGVQGNPGLA